MTRRTAIVDPSGGCSRPAPGTTDPLTRLIRIAVWLAFGAVVAHLLWGLGAPLHGDHVWRQAHVLANVDKLLENGFWSVPCTWNRDLPGRLFALPVQQRLCAALVLGTGLSPVVAGRGLGLVWFALSFLVLRRLLRTHGVPGTTALMTLFFFCVAPIQIYYASTPLPDGLAVMLALLALLSHAEWSSGNKGRRAWLATMVITSALSSAIKAPVFMPVAIAILWMAWRRNGTRVLLDTGYLLVGGVVLATLLAWHAYSTFVNARWLGQDPSEIMSANARWYFGNLSDRLDVDLLGRIFRTLTKYLLNPVTTACAIAAVVLRRRLGAGSASTLPSPFAGWLVGCGALVLVFFNLCWRHSYYLLPCVPPLAWLAARGTCDVLLRRLPAGRWRLLVTLALLSITAGLSVKYVGRLHGSVDARAERAGDWLRNETSPGDFVIYPIVPFDHQPQHLYFAKRNGFMVDATQISKAVMDHICARYAAPDHFHRCLLFVDATLEERLRSTIAGLDLRSLKQGPPGTLYLLH